MISLVGMPGSGKSTVGRHVARQLGVEFVDTDHLIEQRIGCSIREYFELHGEPAFRDVEQAVVAEAMAMPQVGVLATGGGAYMDADTRAMLKDKAITVWLRADLELIWKRVNRRDTRPLLKRENPKQVLADLLETRSPVYAEADIVIDSGDGPAGDAARAIRGALGLA